MSANFPHFNCIRDAALLPNWYHRLTRVNTCHQTSTDKLVSYLAYIQQYFFFLLFGFLFSLLLKHSHLSLSLWITFMWRHSVLMFAHKLSMQNEYDDAAFFAKIKFILYRHIEKCITVNEQSKEYIWTNYGHIWTVSHFDDYDESSEREEKKTPWKCFACATFSAFKLKLIWNMRHRFMDVKNACIRKLRCQV